MKSVTVTPIKTLSGIRKRQIEIKLPNKVSIFSSPCFFIEPKSSNDLNYICKWVENPKLDSEMFQGLVLPYVKASKLLLPKISSSMQKTLGNKSKEEGFSYILKNKQIIIDPQMEAAYFKMISPEEKELERYPKEFKDQIMKLYNKNESKGKARIDKIKSFREYLDTISDKPDSYVLKILRNMKQKGSTILLSPSNLIIPEVPESLDTAIEINKLTKTLCESREGWIPAAYFVLKTSIFEDFEVLSKIIDYINKEIPQLFFFKIVDSYGLDSRNAAIQRANLKKFLTALAEISKNHKIPVFALNVDSLGLFFIQSRIDGFSVPSTGIVEDVYVAYKNTELPEYQRGKYFLYQYLSLVSMRALQIIYERKDKVFPCPCGCCDKYNHRNFKTFIGKTKSELVRTHYFNVMNELIIEAHNAINNNEARAAFNKLANSSCKHYLEILPNFP